MISDDGGGGVVCVCVHGGGGGGAGSTALIAVYMCDCVLSGVLVGTRIEPAPALRENKIWLVRVLVKSNMIGPCPL